MKHRSATTTRQAPHTAPALAVLLIGLLIATGSLWFLGAGYAAVAAAGWFLSWLMIWTSLPMIGHAAGY